jgi:hypothetical protein
MDGTRRRAQIVIRCALLVFVVAWLFSSELRTWIPFWLPFAILLATEAEFVLRGFRERVTDPAGTSPEEAFERRRPGAADADLGWLDVEQGIPAPPRERPRRGRRLAYLAGLAAVIALFVLAYRSDEQAAWSALGADTRSRAEARFSAEASRIAGRTVQVDCDEAYAFTGAGADAAGVAFRNRPLALLAPDICRTLYELAFKGESPSRGETAWAITVLAHEATHLRGIRDEGVTECYALQEGVELGRRLGLAHDEASELMSAQLDRSFAARDLSRLEYRPPPECRDGGSLDLRPQDRAFP